MAAALKHNYNEAYITRLASAMKKAYPTFPVMHFKNKVLNPAWKKMELKQRLHHITRCMHESLSLPYKKAIPVLIKACQNFGGYEGMYFPDYVEQYGQKDLEISLQALEFFTTVSSSEFAVRPFIIKNPKIMMMRMKRWSRNPNEHVRRLSSEGCRPRLPWAMALPAFKHDPSLIFPILDNLKTDASLYVRKSVANNLNDISKDHPDQVIRWCKKNIGKHPHTDWIIKRACRTLLKAAHPDALALFHYQKLHKTKLVKFNLQQKQLPIGETLDFSWTAQQLPIGALRVEYAIHFLKKNGVHTQKKFHVFDGNNQETERIFQKRHSFEQRSTRIHYSGQHYVEVFLNGQSLGKKDFWLA